MGEATRDARLPLAAATALLLVLGACSSRDDATGTSRSRLISDQVHGDGVPGFFWLPPIAPATTYGTFKAGLSPVVTVEELPLGTRPPLATFTTASGTGGATVKSDGVSQYQVNWDTKLFALDPAKMYRIRVTLDGFELGFADVDVVSSGSELRNVQTGEYVPLLDGRTLPVKFRVEADALRCVGVTCQAQDQCHAAGVCDPHTGRCSNPAKADGATCDDGNACTRADTCQAGVCTGADPLPCVAQDQCHAIGTCDPATGACSNPVQPDGLACEDGNACTRDDTCQGGVCTGSNPVTCTARDQCHAAGTCDPATGTCSDPARPDGTACDDQSVCTAGDTCQAGVCAGAAADCSDGDGCTADVCDAKIGCVHLPAPGTATCEVPAPPDDVFVLGVNPVDAVYRAGERMNATVKLQALAAHHEYEVEVLLFPADLPDDAVAEGVSVGGWHFELLPAGVADYPLQLGVPADLPAGTYVLAARQYPSGELVESDQVFVVEASPGHPMLELGAAQVEQAALLVDPEGTVDPADPTLYRDAPFAVSGQLVARNFGAIQVPLTATLAWNGTSLPLRIWDAAQGRWVDQLIVGALDPDAPVALALDLALAEADAQTVRAGLGSDPVPAKVTVAVNAGGSVTEEACVAAPGSTTDCVHAVTLAAVLYAAPPPAADTGGEATFQRAGALAIQRQVSVDEVGGMSLAAAAPTRTAPLTYTKQWSKSFGNDWAGAGVDFTGWAELAQGGYSGRIEGGLPMSVLKNAFDFSRAKLTVAAPITAGANANVRINVAALGQTVYDQVWTDRSVDLAVGQQFPIIQKEIAYSTTIIVYCIPVTFSLGARGSFGLQGQLRAVSAQATPNHAEMTLAAGPWGDIAGFGQGIVGVSGCGGGARVVLSLAKATLTSSAGGSLAVTPSTHGWPLYLTGSLGAKLTYAVTLLSGKAGVFVTYPTVKICKKKVWGVKIYYPCGFNIEEKEKVLCSWPGYTLGPKDFLSVGQTGYVIDLPACVPSATCGNRCGVVFDGCNDVDCGGCAAPQTCGGGGTPNVCGCSATASCDGKCGTIADGCGGTRSCGGCPDGFQCSAQNVCTCAPTISCDGKCGTVDDGCGHQLTCGGCPAGQTCGGGGTPNVCGAACAPSITCEGHCGTMDDGCGHVLECGGCSEPSFCDEEYHQCVDPGPQVTCYPNLAPVIAYTGKYDYTTGGTTYTHYSLPVTNASSFPAELFTITSAYGACGSNPAPSRTWVDVYSSAGGRLYGFCGLDAPAELANVWFGYPAAFAPPSSVYVEITDRACGITYRSNTVTIP